MKKSFVLLVILILFSCKENTPIDSKIDDPFNLSIPYNVTPNSVDLSWSSYINSDFAKYEIYYSLDSNFILDNSTLYQSITKKNQTSITVLNLISDTIYYFKARLSKTNGNKTDSKIQSAITSNPEPFYLTLPYNVTPNSVDLSWSSYINSDFVKYEIYYSLDSNFILDDSTLYQSITNKNQTSTTVLNLISDTTYYFKARLLKTNGNKINSKIQSAITSNEILITLGSPFNITYNSVKIIWSKYLRNDFRKYEIHFSKSSGFEPNENTRYETINNEDIDSTTIENLEPNTKYFFKIKLLLTNGRYFISEEKSGTTWVLLFDKFEDIVGWIGDTLILYNEDDPPDPFDTSAIYSVFAFNSVNLTNYKTVKIEYSAKAKPWIIPASIRTGLNFYATRYDTIPLNTHSVQKFTKYIYDYQISSPEQSDIFFEYEMGSQGYSDRLIIFDVKISAERIFNSKK